jgi:hypothetical protein
MSLGRYLHQSGRADIFLDAFARAVELAPAQPPSAERAEALAALGNGLMLAWRHDESLAVCEEALVIARAVGARPAEVLALTVLGVDLAYLGRGDEGLANLRLALQLAEENGDPMALERAYVNLTDALMMLGTADGVVPTGGGGARRPTTVRMDQALGANGPRLLAMGEWDEADSLSAAAVRAITANYPHALLTAPFSSLAAVTSTKRGLTSKPRVPPCARTATWRSRRVHRESALWERRWTDADEAVRDGPARVPARDRPRPTPSARTAHAGGAGRAARPSGQRRCPRPARCAREPGRRRRAAAAEAATVTPNAAGWLAPAEAEYQRARASPDRRVVGGSGDLGSARTSAARGLLPLAPG